LTKGGRGDSRGEAAEHFREGSRALSAAAPAASRKLAIDAGERARSSKGNGTRTTL
jgi:hypothetical protein